MNPIPNVIKSRVLRTVIDLEDCSASLELARVVASYFELDANEAHRIAINFG